MLHSILGESSDVAMPRTCWNLIRWPHHADRANSLAEQLFL